MPDELWNATLRRYPIFRGLSTEELRDLRDLATTFDHEKTFEGAEGLKLTPEMRASVSAQAALPVLRLGIDWYANWNTVVLVPNHFTNERITRDKAGVIHEWLETESGESWEKGPVVVSWRDAAASGWCDGFNVVIHEAAHRLDMTDGSVNGRPALHKGMSADEWRDVCSSAFEDLRSRSGRRRRSQIDSYATVSDAEFFAVMTEYFFELPHVLRREYPDVFRLFAEFYRQEPSPCASRS